MVHITVLSRYTNFTGYKERYKTTHAITSTYTCPSHTATRTCNSMNIFISSELNLNSVTLEVYLLHWIRIVTFSGYLSLINE